MIENVVTILFGVVVSFFALVIVHYAVLVFFADKFRIPTSSMEPTIIQGDYVMANKLIFGARIYKGRNAIWADSLSTFRTKGLRAIRLNDIVVFNNPFPKGSRGRYRFSVWEVYMKRCIGLPGDTLGIEKGFYCNSSYQDTIGYYPAQELLSKISPTELAPEIIRALRRGDPDLRWNIYSFGPLYIPAIGGTIQLDSCNYKLYALAIEYETGKKCSCQDGVVTLADQPVNLYTFVRNYYFMAGDNVLNSRDSRYFGFVPEEYIIGVSPRILYSYDRDTKRFRWNRFMKRLK